MKLQKTLLIICIALSVPHPKCIAQGTDQTHELVIVQQNDEAKRRIIKANALKFVLGGNYNQLESAAEGFRQNKARFANGDWKLRSFYDAFSEPLQPSDEESWSALISAIQGWGNAKTNSVTARIAMGVAYTGYAWHARGKGWANTVSDEKDTLMQERLEKAVQCLKDALTVTEKCPHWYAAVQRVALGQGWSRDKYERLYSEAVAKEPQYFAYYLLKAAYLLPRWYGKPGEWEAFAEQAATAPNGPGATIYPRILIHLLSVAGTSVFEDSNAVSWDLAQKGFTEWMMQSPESIEVPSFYFYYGGLANDCESMKSISAVLANRFDPYVWESQNEFVQLCERTKHECK